MNKEEFQNWASSPVTIAFLDYLKQEAEIMETLTNSNILTNTVEYNTFSGQLSPLESLGLDCAMRVACVRGLEFAMDRDSFYEYVFGGQDEA